jgi:hypothetical protein
MDCGQGRGKLDNLGFFQEKGGGGERIFRYATVCRCGFSIDAALCRLRTSKYADGEISGFIRTKDTNREIFRYAKIMQAGEIFC